MRIMIALLCAVLGGCDTVESRQQQRARAEGQPYRPGFITANKVEDAAGLPLRNPHWFRQSGLHVLELENGWLVQGRNDGAGLTFVPRPHPEQQ
jgi:hypothetical protein